ncbi:MAG: putative LamG domain protein jellyroll fold domain protein [Chthoniobacteraceae bacterium]|nr:putative LamG domain protein jellyroll fold domain protein [Chthoniobacteraceae bacterium]
MKLCFPSPEFDDAVAEVCHGSVSEEQARALNALLRGDPAARDEYIFRLELHSRLASDPDLFLPTEEGATPSGGIGASAQNVIPLRASRHGRKQMLGWVGALAACVAMLASGWWGWRTQRKGTTSKAVAMLNRVVDAQWSSEAPRLGAPLDPGWLQLKSGLAQIVFYSGARVVIEGPAELQIISPGDASCRMGKLTAEVPPQARGFRIATPQMNVTDLGTVFGLDVREGTTELHVFKGRVEAAIGTAKQGLQEGSGAVAEDLRPPRLISANAARFTSLFNLQDKSEAAESSQYDQWRVTSRRLNQDPSLLVHFDFEHSTPSDWQLHNASSESASDGTIVGCQWVEGRWPTKQALEFRGVSDRVRLSVPGEFTSLTMAAWVRVQGLDRQFNSLFMCDSFDAGTLHWLIRGDGVLGLTVIGPGAGNYQIVPTPSVLRLDQFGMWLHLAVVLNGSTKRVTHYVNGRPVSEKTLKIHPPFRIGTAELGNWNARGFPDNDPSMIRNFSGAMDEFCLFSRALPAAEILALYSSDRPQRERAAAP